MIILFDYGSVERHAGLYGKQDKIEQSCSESDHERWSVTIPYSNLEASRGTGISNGVSGARIILLLNKIY